MTYKYKGRGLLKLTGKQMGINLSSINQLPSNVTISGSNGLSYANTGAVGSSYNQLSAGQLNTISINGLGQLTSKDLFSNHNMHPDVKKYEIYEVPEDVLALSVAWKRLRDNGVHGIVGKLLDRELFSRVTPEDRTNASEIRDYYSKKIMIWKLKGKSLTPFRNDLNNFVHDDGMKIRENVFGMVYYLPSFYEYDIQLDSVREKVKSKDLIGNVINMPGRGVQQDKVLEPITKIKFANKRLKQTQYWLKDVATDGAVVLTIDAKNPLEHIWNHIFETKDLLSIKGNYFVKDKDNFEYFSVSDWNLLKI